MSYYIVQTKPLRRLFPVAHFPYVVYEGEPEQYPFVRVVECADTLRGARRAIERDKKRKAAPFAESVVERVA